MMPNLILMGWYDGPLAGFSRGLAVLPTPCRFECIAWEPEMHEERLYVLAAIDESDIQAAQSLADRSIGGMMHFPPEEPHEVAAVRALEASTRTRLLDRNAILFFSSSIDSDVGLVRSVGDDVARVAEAIQMAVVLHPEDIARWVDVRVTAAPLAPANHSTP
jgi:hypothetical protein